MYNRNECPPEVLLCRCAKGSGVFGPTLNIGRSSLHSTANSQGRGQGPGRQGRGQGPGRQGRGQGPARRGEGRGQADRGEGRGQADRG